MNKGVSVRPVALRVRATCLVFVLVSTSFGAEHLAEHVAALRTLNCSGLACLEELRPAHKPVILRGVLVVPTDAEVGGDSLHARFANTTVRVRASQQLRVPYVHASGIAVGGHGLGELSELPFQEFLGRAKLMQSGLQASLQGQAMCARENLAGHAELAEEMATWEWPELVALARRQGWGPPGQAQFFSCTSKAVTPTHFDEQHGIMAQVQGSKSVTLLPPDAYTAMYPFPVTHVADRSAMADIAAPNLTRFPRLAVVLPHLVTAELHPGDALYVPPMWWHRVEHADQMSTSIGFWFEDVGDVHNGSAFSPTIVARIRRNLEKVLLEEVGQSRFAAEARGLVVHLEAGRLGMPQLQGALALLASVGFRGADAEAFLSETFGGRFEHDIDAFL